MSKRLGIGWKVGLGAIFLLMVGLGTWRQYLKYLDGHGIYSTVLGANASGVAEVVAFIVLPATFVMASVWFALQDFE